MISSHRSVKKRKNGTLPPLAPLLQHLEVAARRQVDLRLASVLRT
jgi:hypothetical protein